MTMQTGGGQVKGVKELAEERWLASPEFLDPYRKLIPAWVRGDEDVITNPDVQIVCGAAIPHLRYVAVAMPLLQACQFALVLYTCTCVAGWTRYPPWIWLPMIILLPFRSYVEIECLKHYTPYFVKLAIKEKMTPFKVMGFACNFHLWLSFYMVCSVLNVLDIGTDTTFASSILTWCSSDDLEMIWSKVWASSLLGILKIPVFKIQSVILASWLLTLLQLIVPLCTTSNKEILCCKAEYTGRYIEENFFSQEMMYSDVFSHLADCAGFATSLNLIQHLSFHKELTLDLGEIEDNITYEWIPLALQMLSRLCLSYVLENCIQMNLQTTVFAIKLYIHRSSGKEGQLQVAFSIGISLMMTLLKLTEAREFFKRVAGIENRLSLLRTDSLDGGGDFPEQDVLKFRRVVWMIRLACAIMVIAICYAACKLVAAFICEDSLWNITGCVDMHAQDS